jgi:hypothetical protein
MQRKHRILIAVTYFVTLLAGVGIALYLLWTLIDPAFTQEEIVWCEDNRPSLAMDVCANEFGY